MAGLLSLPEHSHLAAVLRSFNRVPNYLGDIRYVETTGYQRQKGDGGGRKMIEPLTG